MRIKREKHFTGLNEDMLEQIAKRMPAKNTSADILPLIHYKSYPKPKRLTQSHGLISFQSYIESLLIKTKQQQDSKKRIKNRQKDKIRQNEGRKKEQEQLQKQKNRKKFGQLKRKLKQLKGEMQVEQKKLQLQHSYDQKSNKKEQKLYDRLYQRYAKKDVAECSVNTDPQEAKEGKQASRLHRQSQKQNKHVEKQGRNESIVVHKNLQSILENSRKKQARKESNMQKKTVPKKKDLKRKFRIAALAVLFTILFPKYSKKFHQKRRQLFQSEVTASKLHFQMQKIYELLDTLNLKQIIKQISTKNKKINRLAQADIEQVGSDDEYVRIVFKIDNVSQILITLTKLIKETIANGLVDNLLELLSKLLLHRSFVINHFYLQQELFRLKFHQQYQIVFLSIEQEMILITNFILTKVIGFQFLINSSKISNLQDQKDYLFQRQQVVNKYDQTQRRQILLAGVYLCQLCNQINLKAQVEEQSCFNGNIQEIAKHYMPMNQLQSQNNLKFDQDNNSSNSSIKSEVPNYLFLNPHIKIKQMQDFKSIISGVRQNKTKQSQIISILIDIRKQLYKKMRKFKQEFYSKIKNEHIDKIVKKDQIYDEDIEKPEYLEVFRIQREKFRSEHPELLQKSRVSIESEPEKDIDKILKEQMAAAEQTKQNHHLDYIDQLPSKHDINSSKKRFSNNTQVNNLSNRQRITKKLNSRKGLLKMSNKQFSSGKSIK